MSTTETTREAEIVNEEAVMTPPAAALPAPVTDYGMVRFEAMGHRYRVGHLSEVMIAGQPFLRLDLDGGGIEFYTPSSVYCISPATAPVPRAEIPARFAAELNDAYADDEDWSDDDDDT